LTATPLFNWQTVHLVIPNGLLELKFKELLINYNEMPKPDINFSLIKQRASIFFWQLSNIFLQLSMFHIFDYLHKNEKTKKMRFPVRFF